MRLGDGDLALRRFERDAVLACLVLALAAAVIAGATGGVALALRASLGVLGGGLLMALSYRAIKGAADLLVALATDTTALSGASANKGAETGAADSAAAEWDGRDATAADRVQAQGRVQAQEQAQEQEQEREARTGVLSPGRRVFLVVKFFTRYALLAVAAYVMLSCFRLHPVGLVAGVTSPFLAAVAQVGRLARSRARERHP